MTPQSAQIDASRRRRCVSMVEPSAARTRGIRSSTIVMVSSLVRVSVHAPNLRPRPVTASVSRPGAAIPEAARQVVVDEADALHERVDDRRADEPEPARAAGRPTARPTPASWPGSSPALGVGRQARRRRRAPSLARYASNEPNSRGRRQERRGVADRRVDLGAGSGRSRRRPSAAPRSPSSNAGDDRRVEARGTPPGTPRACAGSSTTTGPPGTTRGRAARTARRRRGQGVPHSSSW